MRIAAKLPRPSRMGNATLALPLAAALALPLMPAANAQNAGSSLAGANGPGSGTGYLEPHKVPDREPMRVTEQNLPGLPEGVSVDKVEWITGRWANVYINLPPCRASRSRFRSCWPATGTQAEPEVPDRLGPRRPARP